MARVVANGTSTNRGRLKQFRLIAVYVAVVLVAGLNRARGFVLIVSRRNCINRAPNRCMQFFAKDNLQKGVAQDKIRAVLALQKEKAKWPCSSTYWIEDRVLNVSIPFTWELPIVKSNIIQRSCFYDSVIVGGPAVSLVPMWFNDVDFVSTGRNSPNVLQKINPFATRTTEGCPRKCGFCGVKVIEPEWKELDDWPDLPILCDNNILAASVGHFDRVCDRLEQWGWCDFNQGIDARLLTSYHAERFKRIGKPVLRLAFDNDNMKDEWMQAYEILRSVGIAKSRIRSYVLIGFNDNPDSAWRRCNFINALGIKPLPMWHHTLDQLQPNIVREDQINLGWTNAERKHIMRFFYYHIIDVESKHRLRASCATPEGSATQNIAESTKNSIQQAECETASCP